MAEPLVFESGDARLTVSPDDGARMRSLVIGGDELLVTEGSSPILWGCYPMAPFAGRIRHGAFHFDGRDVRLPINLAPHAIHGTVFDRAWTVLDDRTLVIDLGPTWPFVGRVLQHLELTDGSLSVFLRLEAEERMPAALGWHPWFRRRLSGTSDRPTDPSPPADLRFDAASMLLRDAEGIPTGKLVRPTPRPWDDCFTDLAGAPALTWPGRLALEIDSSCAYWVVYDEPEPSICVEPQSSPPDFIRLAPVVVEPGRPLTATMTWRWRRLDAMV
jgi:aldose 1-epimerase